MGLIIFFFFNDTATTEIYTLSLHDALPILPLGTVALDGTKIHANASRHSALSYGHAGKIEAQLRAEVVELMVKRSEEHTSELQSRQYLVCRLLLEKKKNINSIAVRSS